MEKRRRFQINHCQGHIYLILLNNRHIEDVFVFVFQFQLGQSELAPHFQISNVMYTKF